MQQTREICYAVFENGAAVLMARIVDEAGVCVRSSQVIAIRYSIYELSWRQPEKSKVVAGHDDVRLAVDEVFLEGLEADRSWSVDVVGYNFRHEIAAVESSAFPKRGARYEIRYTFIPKDGGKVFVCFRVKVAQR